MRYLTLADHASGFPDDEILTAMLRIFGNHESIYFEIERILKLTPAEARQEIADSVPVDDYERQYIAALLETVDQMKASPQPLKLIAAPADRLVDPMAN